MCAVPHFENYGRLAHGANFLPGNSAQLGWGQQQQQQQQVQQQQQQAQNMCTVPHLENSFSSALHIQCLATWHNPDEGMLQRALSLVSLVSQGTN